MLLKRISSLQCSTFFFFNDTATTEIYTLSLHDALPIWKRCRPSKAVPASQATSRARTILPVAGSKACSFSPLANQTRLPSKLTPCTCRTPGKGPYSRTISAGRSEEHTSELQSQFHLVCRLLLEKKKKQAASNIAAAGSCNRLVQNARAYVT